MIITLCGSTKFKYDFFDVAKELTLKGNIVLMPFVFAHSGDIINNIDKIFLDELHLEKINISDAIFVINKDNYIGDSTSREINYAKTVNKKIFYLE